MKPDFDLFTNSCSFEVTATAPKCERLNARVIRWTKLCNELSACAIELKSLREKLGLLGNQRHDIQRLLDDRVRELRQCEVEIERDCQVSEPTLQERIRQEQEHPVVATDESNILAEFENHATDFNHGATDYIQREQGLAAQLESCGQELYELGKELEAVQLSLNYE